MTHQPVPDAALDDRLAFVGTAGSGKTYNAMGRVERIVRDATGRVIIGDPLGVWWGMCLMADGKTAAKWRRNLVIFGGPHGDLPITENAGTLIGQTVAGMAESCILDLSEFGTKAAERRFMLAFLNALYRHASGEPVHLVFDEADMWAPERLLDRDGDAARLLGQMETIVRRGRIKGFIPWLITQRPAVLSKNVLSQVDGLVAFKLTSSQDRDAIGNWVEGQADKAQWKQIWASLPTMERGQGVVWMPARGILETVQFPAKLTFDSSRTPKRGETKKSGADLKPLDLSALEERLASVEAEAKASDPAALRKELADARRQIVALQAAAAKPAKGAVPAPQPAAPAIDETKLQALIASAEAIGRHNGRIEHAQEILPMVKELKVLGLPELAKAVDRLAAALEKSANAQAKPLPSATAAAVTGKTKPAPYRPAAAPASAPARTQVTAAPVAPGLTKTEQRVLDSLAWWEAIGVTQPDKGQVGFIAGYRVGEKVGGTFGNILGKLRSQGLLDYPSASIASLTDEGRRFANPPQDAPTTAVLQSAIHDRLDGPESRVLQVLIDAHPEALTKQECGARANYNVGEKVGGTFGNILGRLRSLGLIDYPAAGQVVALPVLFLESR